MNKFILTILGVVVAVVVMLFVPTVIQAESLAERVSGQILLQVEQNGEAWYVYPETLERHYMGRPTDAFDLMRELGLGVASQELDGYLGNSFPARLAGLIMLDVERNGEAYYVYPDDLKGYYLGRPADAFAIMRNLGLGITDSDLAIITEDGEVASVEDDEGNNYIIVDTGQTSCFGTQSQISCPAPNQSYYGQDAQFAGNLPSYTDNSDGTVTDSVTGLMWTKAFVQVDWTDSFSEALADRTGGYDDWRVPTIKELYSLMDFSGNTGSGQHGTPTIPADAVPYLDTNYFDFEYGQGSRFIDAQYLSSTEYVYTTMGGNDTIFGVNFADGRIKGYPKSGTAGGSFYARYVRGNPSYGQNNFVDNNNQTITDKATGLMWTKDDDGQGLIWKDALSYCLYLDLAGYSDWRLPNAKELQGLVDYARSPDTTSSPAINPIFNVSEIVNEGNNTDYPFYWTGTSHQEGEARNAVYVAFGRALGFMSPPGGGSYTLMDVHGASAQRSDPKLGDPNDYPYGRGPQGDVIRIYNHVRCVR